MTDLLAPLNDDQMVLLRCISGPLAEQGQYPIWQYVEAELDRQDLDAREVLRSLPLARVLAPGALYYGPIAGDLTLTDDSRLRLTVAGFYQLAEFRERVGQFFIRLLNFLIERRKFARLTPFEVSRVEVTGKEIDAMVQSAAISIFSASSALAVPAWVKAIGVDSATART
jgi:hypothetical protein